MSVNAKNELKKLLHLLPCECHIKVHKAYNVTVWPTWEFKDRINRDLHICYVKGGQGHYEYNNKKEHLHKGKIVFVSNNYKHSGYKDSNSPLSFIPLRFGIYENKNPEKQIEHPTEPFTLSYIHNNTRKYLFLFENLYNSFHPGKDPFRQPLCGAFMTSILIELYNDLLSRQSHEFDHRLETTRVFLDEHPSHPLNIDILAEMASLSPKYFSNLFKRQYGTTPKEYLVKSRINAACFLLEDARKNINEVAYELGYSDQYAFSKQFKKIMECSPSEYRHIK